MVPFHRSHTIFYSAYIYRHRRSLLSSELINVACVLLELISVRDGAFYLHDFDDVWLRSFMDCICSL